jgi:hypothetical protein
MGQEGLLVVRADRLVSIRFFYDEEHDGYCLDLELKKQG